MSGAVPDFSDNPKLEELRLSYNQLTGSIPRLEELDSLRVFTASVLLPSGIYFLYLENNKGQSSVNRFVKI